MSLLTLGILLFSFTGILFGLALSFIAPEERGPGKKYFILFKWFLFFLIVILFGYYFFIFNLVLLSLLSIILGFILFFIIIKSKNPLWELVNYFFFSLLYLLQQEIFLQSLLAVLIFLYGFPTGTLLRRIPRA